MKLIQKIDLFKIAIVAILVILIIMLNDMSKNGRYQLDPNESWIIDTRTGNVYHLKQNDFGSILYLTPDFPQNHK